MTQSSRQRRWLLALLFMLTVPVTMSVLMLPMRLLRTAMQNLPLIPFLSALSLVWFVFAVAGTIGVHVKMWRSFARRDRAEPN